MNTFDEEKIIELINSFPVNTENMVIHIPVPKELTLDEYMQSIADEMNNKWAKFVTDRWDLETKMKFRGVPIVLDTAIDKIKIETTERS
jgi:hypothetical protein